MSDITATMAREMIRLDSQIERLNVVLSRRSLPKNNLAKVQDRLLYLSMVRERTVNERSYLMQQEWARAAADKLQEHWREPARI